MRGVLHVIVGLPLLVVAGCGDSTPSAAPADVVAPPQVGVAPVSEPGHTPLDDARTMIGIAREGPLVKRSQAAERLSTLGAPAVEALMEIVGDSPRDLAQIGSDLLRPCAELGDERLRARLWAAAVDVDFPFRPMATQWLARTALATERSGFDALLADPLSLVRVAAIAAIESEGDRQRETVLVKLLNDQSDGVRRAAADLLVRWGHPFALRWLLEDLARSDRYFDLETGRNARFEAARLMRRYFDRALMGYEPGREPDEPANAVALVALHEEVEQRAGTGTPTPPARALRTSAVIDGVFGLEVISCRRGEFHLAITGDDQLVVGIGHPVVMPLEAGASERLRAAVAAQFDAIAAAPFVGELGCDVECYRLRAADGTTLVARVMKGPADVKDLRPAALDALAAAFLAELPGDLEADVVVPGSKTALDALLTDALGAVGGALP